MTMTEIFRWANQNQGVLSLFAVLLYFPTLLILVYRGVRKVWPSRQERRLKIQEEFAHAERLKKKIESRVRWDKVLSNYGEFLIRDAERRLAETEEIHSRVAAPY